MKKINCKQGLATRQELEARKIRKILIGELEDEERKVENRIKKLYEEYKIGYKRKGEQKNIYFFYNYIGLWDIVIYSAFERIGGLSEFSEFVVSMGLF